VPKTSTALKVTLAASLGVALAAEMPRLRTALTAGTDRSSPASYEGKKVNAQMGINFNSELTNVMMEVEARAIHGRLDTACVENAYTKAGTWYQLALDYTDHDGFGVMVNVWEGNSAVMSAPLTPFFSCREGDKVVLGTSIDRGIVTMTAIDIISGFSTIVSFKDAHGSDRFVPESPDKGAGTGVMLETTGYGIQDMPERSFKILAPSPIPVQTSAFYYTSLVTDIGGGCRMQAITNMEGSCSPPPEKITASEVVVRYNIKSDVHPIFELRQ
jgi:hypothetical protein